jgi:hypothetical protein
MRDFNGNLARLVPGGAEPLEVVSINIILSSGALDF